MQRRIEIKDLIENQRCTLLGVGPMSKECVDVAVELASQYKKPLLLIASRRQIDGKEFGGGYVEKWTTKDFAKYVRQKDKCGHIILARDHGGPWQNSLEVANGLTLDAAMESAKVSFREDIESGFEIIHIDTSIDIHDQPDEKESVDRLIELYDFCITTAKEYGREIMIEIGTEEQSGGTDTIERNREMLTRVDEILGKRGLQRPDFVVMQTGTRVLSDRNVGSLDSLRRQPNEVPPFISVPQILSLCKDRNVYLKEHNLDYVSDELLRWHPKLGIHAANVAPEFGVRQSKVFMSCLEENGLDSLRDRAVQIGVESGKWKKWIDPLVDDNPERKAVLCLHYSFACANFKALRLEAENELRSNGIELTEVIMASLRKTMSRYLRHFNY